MRSDKTTTNETGWSDEELGASVKVYFDMLSSESSGQKFNKRAAYRDLARRFGRTPGAFEYRMQNISAVFQEAENKWVSGLKPARNVGSNVQKRLIGLVQSQKVSKGPLYLQRLPQMRQRLIGLARIGARITYGELMKEFDLNRFVLRHAMARLGWDSKESSEPIITALIVNAATGRCSPGLEKEFSVADDEKERARLYAYWGIGPGGRSKSNSRTRPGAVSLKRRAKSFAQVETRPEQAAFRERVFLSFGGRCAITGCEVEHALDAAHIHGRDWRKGHNGAKDGLLLRKDLHALYDRKLIHISRSGVVAVEAGASAHYAEFSGTSLRKRNPSNLVS